MASTRIIEQEHGTYAGRVTHRHNGYYAGDFGSTHQPIALAVPPAERFATTADARPPMQVSLSGRSV